MMLWIPKRAEKGGWSFYSITVPSSLVIIVIVLIALLAVCVRGALRQWR